MKDKPKLEKILEVCIRICGADRNQAISRSNLMVDRVCRGMYYLVAWDFGYHPKDVASIIGRKRSSCIITTCRYRGYYTTKDKEITKMYNDIVRVLKNG